MANSLRHSSKALFFFPLFVALGGMGGCANQELAKEKFKKAGDEAKLVALEERLNQQTRELEDLRLHVKKLSAREWPKPTSSIREVTKAPSDSIFPSAEELQGETDDRKGQVKADPNVIPAIPSLFGHDEDTVADSSQESMHYYYEALQDIADQKFEGALKVLHQFLSLNPQHVYADRAQFLITDTHFKNKEYGLAVVASNLLEARYPHSLKLPEALYERAKAYLSLDQKGQAKTAFESLLARYPKTPVATGAARELALLSNSAANNQANDRSHEPADLSNHP